MRSDLKRILIQDPDRVSHDEFCYDLLDEIFVEHCGLGRGTQTMTIGDVEFTKTITGPHFSNSRKSKDFAKKIEGGGYVFEKKSKYKKEKK